MFDFVQFLFKLFMFADFLSFCISKRFCKYLWDTQLVNKNIKLQFVWSVNIKNSHHPYAVCFDKKNLISASNIFLEEMWRGKKQRISAMMTSKSANEKVSKTLQSKNNSSTLDVLKFVEWSAIIKMENRGMKLGWNAVYVERVIGRQ